MLHTTSYLCHIISLNSKTTRPPKAYAPGIIPFGPKSLQGPQYSSVYTLPPPPSYGKRKETRGSRERVLNTVLLNPSAGDLTWQKLEQVGKD